MPTRQAAKRPFVRQQPDKKKGGGAAVAVVVGGGALGGLIWWLLSRRRGGAASGPVPVEIALAELIATGHIILVSQFNPTTGLFEAFVPGLPGNTLTVIRPNIPIRINLTQAHTVLSSGVVFFIPANTPTEVAVGATVSITLVS